MSGLDLYWFVMGAGLVAYTLTGGADFGGGVWDLLASGRQREGQRAAIEHAIAPIWEANHVWLIFVIVVMFTVFPEAFALIGTALHIPITLALIGIVLRGAAFTFRAYGLQPRGARERWGRVFAWSSALTPIFLGMTLAGLSSGAIRLEGGRLASGFLAGWLTPFGVLVGLLALALFALLAAVYLAAESEGEVQEAFRWRALVTELVAGLIAASTLACAAAEAPALFAGLARSPWALPAQLATAGAAAATAALLWARRFRLARLTAATQVALVVIGWGLAMDRHLVLPAMRLEAAGSRPEILGVLGLVLAAGALVLLPALWVLFRVFKGPRREASG